MTRKIQNLLSAGAGAIGLVTAVGVKTFLRPCVHADGSAAPCAGAGQLILVLGILLALDRSGAGIWGRGRPARPRPEACCCCPWGWCWLPEPSGRSAGWRR